MLADLFQDYSIQLQTLSILLTLINALLHLIFAGGIAKDAGMLNKMGQKTALVSGPVWAFSTLIGGVFVAAIYWFIHHSNLTRPLSRDKSYE